MAAKRVFITRDLSEAKLFRQLLTEQAFSVFGESLIKFEAVDFGAIPEADWVFFYSKKAARFFLEGLQTKGLSLGERIKVGTIGEGTTYYLKQKKVNIHFTGDGHPESTAKAFARLVRGQRILFPRARHSRKSIQNLLEGQGELIDLVVYNNEARTSFNPPLVDYLVVTSPLNARVWFTQAFPSPDIRTLAIGNTTARALEKLQVPDFRTAASPSEQTLAEAIMTWDRSG